jgi:hypothetical protein
VWWWANAWRTFATVNLSRDAQKVGTSTSTFKDDEGHQVKMVKDLFEGGGSGTVEFLKHICEVIGIPGSDEGCKKLIEEFKALGVPTMPDPNTVAWVEKQITLVPGLAKGIADFATITSRDLSTKGVQLAKAGAAHVDQWVVDKDAKINSRKWYHPLRLFGW